MEPCCMLVVAETIGSWPDVIALGPVFSSHAWSIDWDATICPNTSPIFGVARWVIAGK